MYLFQISNYDDPAVDRETVELLHQCLEAESWRRCPAMWKALKLWRAVDWEKFKTTIRFEDAGVTICAGEKEEHLSYTRIKSVFESVHLWLVVCDDGRALLLQKKDLRSGNADSFLSDIISKMNTGADASG